MSRVGHRYYGKTSVAIVGRQSWEAQDGTKTWTDGGAVQKALQDAAQALERVVAENATLAVSDYLSTAEAGIRADKTGEVLIGLRIANEEAAMMVEVPLRRLIVAALSEMRPALGIDPQAQQTVSAIVAFGQQLSALGSVRTPTPLPEKERIAS